MDITTSGSHQVISFYLMIWLLLPYAYQLTNLQVSLIRCEAEENRRINDLFQN